MAIIVFETSDGMKRVGALEIEYDDARSAWVVDLGKGGSSGISDVGKGIQQLVIPEQRVYRVELTESEAI